MRKKITERDVKAIEVTAGREMLVWDTETRGFALRVRASGARSWVVQYRNKYRRTRRLTIGSPGAMRVETARKLARELLARVARGEDPAAERDKARDAPTVGDLAERYLTEHARPRKKPRSIEEDERNLRLHILPALGTLPVEAVTETDVSRLHNSMRATPTGANRVLALLSCMFNLAERWGLRKRHTNPCQFVGKYREKARKRHLSEIECRRLGKVLEEAERSATEDPAVIAAIRLCIFSGMRRNEILTLQWEHVDFDRGFLHLPDSKTGAKDLPLNNETRDIIERIDRQGPWVLPGKKPGTHLVGIEKAWARIRRRASLDDVHLHDLRHTVGSVAAEQGAGQATVAAMLGHKDMRTAARYIHTDADSVRAASNKTSKRIAEAMQGRTLKRVK